MKKAEKQKVSFSTLTKSPFEMNKILYETEY